MNININFLNNLNDKHFVAKMFDEFFHLFDKVFNIDELNSKLNDQVD